MIRILFQILSGNKVKNNEVVWGIYHIMGERRGTYKEFLGKPKINKHVENVNVYGRIILRWIIKKWNRSAWTGFI
jgi:hypothetical protein